MSSSLETPLDGPGVKITQTLANAVQEVPPELARKFTEVASRLRALGDNPNIPAIRVAADDMVKKGLLIKVGGEVEEEQSIRAVTYFIPMPSNPKNSDDFRYPALDIHSFMSSEIYIINAYNERGQEIERVKRSRNSGDQYPHTTEAERALTMYHSNGQMAKSEVRIHTRTSDGGDAEEVTIRMYDEKGKLTGGETRSLERGVVVKTEPISPNSSNK